MFYSIAYGSSLGVTGTPKFFVGTIKNNEITDVAVISGAAAFARFESEIKRRL